MIVHCLYDSGPVSSESSESESSKKSEVPSESEFMCVLSCYGGCLDITCRKLDYDLYGSMFTARHM